MRAVARTPEEVDALFAERVNAGDIDGVVELYEEGAVHVAGSGDAAGREAIRPRVANWVADEMSIECSVVAVHRSGDTAVLYNEWRGTRRGPCGERLGVQGKALEIVRQQRDGSWLFLIDDPFGRG